MRSFTLGIIVTLLVLVLGGLAFALLGFMPSNANATPSHMEMRVAMNALDASMDRHAPRLSSPIPPTDLNLIDGMKIYTMNCALCHGGIDRQPSVLEKSFYPPPPNLIMDPPDDPEWHLYFVIRNGVRYTGMPAWDKALTEPDIWKVTAFLARIDKLPPAVQDYWKKSSGASLPTAAPEDHGEHRK